MVSATIPCFLGVSEDDDVACKGGDAEFDDWISGEGSSRW